VVKSSDHRTKVAGKKLLVGDKCYKGALL